MRARDGDEGIRAFARSDPEGRVWTEWGAMHPLAPTIARQQQGTVLIEAHGRWRFLPDNWPERSIYEALAPILPLAGEVLQPDADVPKLEIRMRLVASAPQDPELFLLTPDELYDLEDFVRHVSSEQLRRLMITRLSDVDGGVHYVLRERWATQAQRLGSRLVDIAGRPGFVKHEALDNLYLSVGRRLQPTMRRDELRRLFGLDRHRLVLLEDDELRGPRQVTIDEANETALVDWLTFVAFDRRLALDALEERAVFEFPGMEVAELADAGRAPFVPPPAPKRDRTARARPRRRPRMVDETADDTVEGPVDVDLAAARARRAELESELAEGGIDQAEPWAELAEVTALVGERLEAGQAAENAVFFAPMADRGPHLDRLARLREARSLDDDDVLRRALNPALTPHEAAVLATATLDRIEAGRPPQHGVMEAMLERVPDAGFPISRRLAWLVLSAWYRHADDRLGLTRAQERIIGTLNAPGLSEVFDLPAFVRPHLGVFR